MISGAKPLNALKNQHTSGRKGVWLRNVLVVVQFVISIALLTFTLFVQKQLNYTATLDIGFEKRNILQLHHMDQLGSHREVLKRQIASDSRVSHVGHTYAIPPNIWDGERYKTKDPSTPVVDMSNFRTEPDYIDLLGL